VLLSRPSQASCIALVHAHAHRRQRLLSGSVADNSGTHMSTVPTFDANPFHTERPFRTFTPTTDISPFELDGTPITHGAKDYFQHIKPQPAADYFTRGSNTSIHKLDAGQSDIGSGASRADSRREGLRWNLGPPPQEDINKYNRSPLGMSRIETRKPSVIGIPAPSTTDDRFVGVAPRRAHEEPASDMSKRRFSINFFKRRQRFSDETAKEKKQTLSLNRPSWLRKMPSTSRSEPPTSLADIPVPPTFIPPGLQRIPTPTFDAPAHIKGKLADFFFDIPGSQSISRRRPKASPDSVWDSDAILMSMDPGLDISDESDEGPKGHSLAPESPNLHLGSVNDDPPGLVLPPDASSNTGSQLGQLSSGGPPWYRIRGSDNSGGYKLTAAALKEADKRRKFEWLVPEHLPNSPVCPLHAKYRGPSKGLCYWHGRESNGYGVAPVRSRLTGPSLAGQGSTDSSSGWSTGRQEIPKLDLKKRRLASLSTP
jgi:hypothetical protein